MSGSIFYTIIYQRDKIPQTMGRGAVSEEATQMAQRLVQSILPAEPMDPMSATRRSFVYRQTNYNLLLEDNTVYLCLADDVFPRRIVFKYLDRLREELKFRGSVSKTFIRAEMEFYSNNPEADKLRLVQQDVDEVKDIMLENIDRVLRRGENLEEVQRKTEELQINARGFNERASTLKCALIQQNVKLSLLMGGIIGFFLLLFGGLIIWQIAK